MAGTQHLHLQGQKPTRTACDLIAAGQRISKFATCPWCIRGEKFPVSK
jgi:hypothetical protein